MPNIIYLSGSEAVEIPAQHEVGAKVHNCGATPVVYADAETGEEASRIEPNTSAEFQKAQRIRALGGGGKLIVGTPGERF